ncbi:methanogenesis marker 17 protein [Methanopyrus sp. SNP6]|uniref:methanogenesis marker 17 protein n=1 Tax=Methanopyrus sp. SNP6 TaxID=1937005 RepID=UPI0011E5BB98|nr:methanogenesis marker 17 protein [Methanopyrus sp. SNP6]
MYEHMGKRILVRASEKEAAELYYDIARHAATDLGLARTITAAVFHLDIEAPLYAAAVRTRPMLRPVTLGKVSHLELDDEEGTLKVSVAVERYFPDVIRTLQDVFGEDRVRHEERLKITVEPPEGMSSEHLEKLEELVVHDPRKKLAHRVYDLIERVRPEGFRVARYARFDRDFLYLASEGVLKDEWTDLLFELPGDLDRVGERRGPSE